MNTWDNWDKNYNYTKIRKIRTIQRTLQRTIQRTFSTSYIESHKILTDKLKSYSYRNTLKAIHQFAKLVKGMIFYYISYIFLICIFLTLSRINA